MIDYCHSLPYEKIEWKIEHRIVGEEDTENAHWINYHTVPDKKRALQIVKEKRKEERQSQRSYDWGVREEWRIVPAKKITRDYIKIRKDKYFRRTKKKFVKDEKHSCPMDNRKDKEFVKNKRLP